MGSITKRMLNDLRTEEKIEKLRRVPLRTCTRDATNEAGSLAHL